MKAFFHMFKVISWNLDVLAVPCVVFWMQGYLGEFIPNPLCAYPVHNLVGHC